MPRPQERAPVLPALVALGAVLVVGLTVLAFAGGRLLGRHDGDPTAGRVATAALLASPPARSAPAAPPSPATPPARSSAARAPVVCLDPGHGGPDRGFARDPGGPDAMEEAELVLGHALALEERLSRRGFRVVLTRRADEAVNADGRDVNGDGKTIADDPPWPAAKTHWTLDDLQARIDACNAAGAELLVSLHVNGHPNPGARGFEAWYTRERPFGAQSRRFADLAYAHLKDRLARVGYVLLPEEERGVYPDSAANVQSEHARLEHFVLTGPAVEGAVDPSRMPGAIVETLFLSNDGDAFVLADPGGREAIVAAYEGAIVEYFAASASAAGSTAPPTS